MALWYSTTLYDDKIIFNEYKWNDSFIEWTPPDSATNSPSYGKIVGTWGIGVGMKMHLPENSQYIFAGCTGIEPQYWITSGATSMQGMFKDSSVTSLDLSTWDTSNVTNMLEMFYNASSLTSLNLSNWDTSKVTNMGAMFSLCSGLTTLDLSSFNTYQVSSIQYMFWNCSSLVTILVNEFSTRKVSASNDMFYNCTSIVGENNTTYSADNVGGTYARVDNPPTAPGYFTAKYHWIEHTPYIKVDGLWTRCQPYNSISLTI